MLSHGIIHRLARLKAWPGAYKPSASRAESRRRAEKQLSSSLFDVKQLARLLLAALKILSIEMPHRQFARIGRCSPSAGLINLALGALGAAALALISVASAAVTRSVAVVFCQYLPRHGRRLNRHSRIQKRLLKVRR